MRVMWRCFIVQVTLLLVFACSLTASNNRMHCARPSLLKHCNTLYRHSQGTLRQGRQRRSFSASIKANMSNWQYPSPIEYGARGQHSATVIVLHGLGDTGDGWSFLPTQLRGDFKHVKFVFPNAPTVRQRQPLMWPAQH
jgi:hypothetical protein